MTRGLTMLRRLIAVLAVAAGIVAVRPVMALEVEYSGHSVPREILALYDSRHEATPQTTRIYLYGEMPLNWLGYKVNYADVNQPLPPLGEMSRYRGVLTWFVEPMAAADTYLAWIDRVTAAGTKLAVISELVPNEPTDSNAVVSRVLARLGLEWTNQFVAVTHRVQLAKIDKQMVGFERQVDKALPDFAVYKPIPGTATVHLSVTARLRDGPTEAVLVATGPGGGYASDEYALHHEASIERDVWTINPFLFFKRAFGEDRFPIPDVTTLSGRRMYFSHIDGDGWNNVSEIETYRDAQVISADVIRREVVEPYPDLPVSIGVIAGDTIPELGGTTGGRDVAVKLYALPQVEVASHTYSHPFNWKYFESYIRADEERLIDAATRPAVSTADWVRSALFKTAGKILAADKSNKYIAGSDALPRTYLKDPFDLTKEVQGALNVAESLAPPGKKAMLYLWSGDTTPFEGAIAATRAAGVRNMNGGDSRLDKEYPSVFYVPPISRPNGRQRQIFAANSNENTYTNDWLGPYYGFFMLERTLENTEVPRRLKPFNLYYHMYSGEKAASLASIKYFAALARKSNVIPVTASRYAGIADDFFNVEIEQVDVTAWAIRNRGTLSTVRFDDADLLEVDGSRSPGVIGANRHQGSLYVTLDPAVGKPIVALRARGQTGLIASGDPVASLVEARWTLSGVQAAGCGFQATAQGFGPGEMVWSTNAGRAFRIVLERDGKRLAEEVRWADQSGLLKLKYEVDATQPLTVRFDCHE